MRWQRLPAHAGCSTRFLESLRCSSRRRSIMRWERYVLRGLFCLLLLLVVAVPCGAALKDSNAFFDAIKKQDVASVREALQSHPDWANAKDSRGRTAVLAALFVISNDGFLPRDRNPVLQAILERSPTLTFYDAC